MYHNGEWGTVCGGGWDLNDAQVVCNELGFSNAVTATRQSFFGHLRISAWLCDLQCVGTESSITNCSHSGWRRIDWRYYVDGGIAGVICVSGNICFGY